MTNTLGTIADQLKHFIERLERLDGERQTVVDDMKDVLAEAKSNGYDPKIIRQILKIRKMEKAEREEAEALLDTYMHAIGMAS